MGYEAKEEPSSIPKLPLFSLPSKPSKAPEILTPPIHTLASVPFLWEEAPGKPRACTTTTPKSKTARCLDLPPRLVAESKITNLPSPTTVLDGPFVGQSLSHTLSFSFGKESFINSPQFRGIQREKRGNRSFGSWRWGSFKENSGVLRGNIDFSPSISVAIGSDFSPSVGGAIGSQSDSKGKIMRIRRRSSFWSLSHSRSNILDSVYQSFKHAVPWRGRQDKQRHEAS